MSSINVKPTLKLDTAQQMPPPSNPDNPTPNPNPKPILKLNTKSRQSSFSGDIGTPTPSGGRKIKIKLNSQPSTPAAVSGNQTPSVTKSKAGRMSKPTAKLIEARKRPHDSDDEDQPLSLSRHESNRPDKKIKVTSKSTPIPLSATTPISSIKFKPRGEPVEHHPGDAYDSEASDREADPVRETTFILRALPGSPAEYLHTALSEGTIGIPKQNGGADFGVQFLDGKQRRAMVTINGKFYAAVLVHLPTITEAMKSWDRKNMMKNSDVTEMLLCHAEVKNESEARTVPLPTMVAKYEHKWPHGITPPMHDAVHRRFRKTLSEKQWQSSAEIVSKLLEEDAAALESHVEFLQDEDGDVYSDDEEDAEGEAEQDYFGDIPMEDAEEEDDEMLAAMEAELAEGLLEEEEPTVATPAVKLEAPTPTADDMNTPAGAAEEIMSEEDEDEEDEDDEDEDEEMDDEQLTAERERKEKVAELEHLERQYEDTKRQLTEVTAPILKKRLLSTKASLEKEISIKKAALGFAAED